MTNAIASLYVLLLAQSKCQSHQYCTWIDSTSFRSRSLLSQIKKDTREGIICKALKAACNGKLSTPWRPLVRLIGIPENTNNTRPIFTAKHGPSGKHGRSHGLYFSCPINPFRSVQNQNMSEQKVQTFPRTYIFQSFQPKPLTYYLPL